MLGKNNIFYVPLCYILLNAVKVLLYYVPPFIVLNFSESAIDDKRLQMITMDCLHEQGVLIIRTLMYAKGYI
jgi:hypothetical protein